MNLAPKYEVALLQSIQSCFEISNYFSLILYRCKDYPIDHRCTYFVDYVHGSSLNRNYNGAVHIWHSRFSVSLLRKYNNRKWQRAKKKWQGVPPKIKFSTKKTSQTNQKNNLPDKQDLFAASRDGDERERRSPLPEIIRSSYPHLG